MFVVNRKAKAPAYNMNPSYGLLYKMPRMSKDGKMIGVYKFRTMHPYAEYLHDYVLKKNGYAATGKPADDFRLTPWGKVLRRYWLDELPQVINLLKGDLKLVGVRPISKRFFEDIPADLQSLRVTQKPGCIPPYVSLNRNSDVTTVLEAEREYILASLANPFATDVRFFFAALFNIVVRNKRSA
jgi:lipopolysaccharide/colanic/teichoic acid biosynthesis glycosyltransferase